MKRFEFKESREEHEETRRSSKQKINFVKFFLRNLRGLRAK